jgi:hypothetical protein
MLIREHDLIVKLFVQGAWESLFKHEGSLGTAGKQGAKQGGRVTPVLN